MSLLRLEIGGLSLSLGIPGVSPFSETSFPRERIDGPTLNYSIRGNSVEEGTAYEPKHIWQLDVILDESSLETLNTMYDYFLLTKPRPEVVIHDYVKKVREPGPRTRGLADGASSSALPNPIGWIAYYGKFQGRFTKDPKIAEEGAFYKVSFQIQETGKTEP